MLMLRIDTDLNGNVRTSRTEKLWPRSHFDHRRPARQHPIPETGGEVGADAAHRHPGRAAAPTQFCAPCGRAGMLKSGMVAS